MFWYKPIKRIPSIQFCSNANHDCRFDWMKRKSIRDADERFLTARFEKERGVRVKRKGDRVEWSIQHCHTVMRCWCIRIVLSHTLSLLCRVVCDSSLDSARFGLVLNFNGRQHQHQQPNQTTGQIATQEKTTTVGGPYHRHDTIHVIACPSSSP